jgi:hypothetical protein
MPPFARRPSLQSRQRSAGPRVMGFPQLVVLSSLPAHRESGGAPISTVSVVTGPLYILHPRLCTIRIGTEGCAYAESGPGDSRDGVCRSAVLAVALATGSCSAFGPKPPALVASPARRSLRTRPPRAYEHEQRTGPPTCRRGRRTSTSCASLGLSCVECCFACASQRDRKSERGEAIAFGHVTTVQDKPR